MHSHLRYALSGFFFGAVGLYALAMLALISPVFETLFSPLMAPGRFVAGMFVGAEGSNFEVVLLTLFNGVFYALIFVLVAWVLKRKG